MTAGQTLGAREVFIIVVTRRAPRKLVVDGKLGPKT